MTRILTTLAMCAALLAGCASTQTDTPTRPTPTPPPLVVPATPSEIWAAIIVDADVWEAVAADATRCVSLYILDPDVEQLDTVTCWASESAMTLTAEAAAARLRTLTPPAALEASYSDLLAELDAITIADVSGQCVDGPATPTCKAAREGIHVRYMRVADMVKIIRATASSR